MACTVNKIVLENGQESTLFKQLQENLGDAHALAAYLELNSNKEAFGKLYGLNEQGEVDAGTYLSTPKYKLEEFQKYPYRYQSDVMSLLTMDFIRTLGKETKFYLEQRAREQNKKVKKSTTLTGIDTNIFFHDSTTVERVIEAMENDLATEIRHNQNKYPKHRLELLQIAADNLRNYLVAPDGTLGPVGLKLQHHGIFVKSNYKQSEQEQYEQYAEDTESFDNIDLDKKQIQQARIYDLSILEVNPANNILGQLKLFLKSQPKVDKAKFLKNPNSKDIYEKGIMGENRLATSSVLYAKLTGVLSEVQDANEIVEKIRLSLPSNPELAPIYRELVNEVPVKIDKVGDYSPLKVALFSLAKANYNPWNIVEKGRGVVVPMEANSGNTRSQITSMWKSTIEEKAATKGALQKAAQIRKLINSTATKEGLNRKASGSSPNSFTYAPSKILLREFANEFVNAGYDYITADTLSKVIKRVLANPKLLAKDLNSTTPHAIMQALVTRTLIKGLKGGKVFAKNFRDGESKIIRLLAKEASKNRVDFNTGAFLTSNNKMIHPHNLPSAAQDTFTLLTTNSKYIEDFKQDPIYTNSRLMQIFEARDTEDFERFEVHTLNSLSTEGIGKDYEYGSLSTFDSLVTRANSYFSPNGNADYYMAHTPTQGDRGNLMMLNVPKFNMKGDTKGTVAGSVILNGDRIAAPDIKKWIENTLRGELTRIVSHPKGIKNYSGKVQNVRSFSFFKALDSELEALNLDESRIERAVTTLMPKAEKAFIEMIESDKKYYQDEQIYTKTKDGYKFSSVKIRSRYARDARELTPAQMDTFIANSLIYNHESSLYLIGDAAFYSSNSDTNKRMALPFTPGTKLAVGEGTGMRDDSFVVKVIKEPTATSEFAEVYNKLLGKEKASYKDTEIADGYGMVSIDRYRKTMLAQGKHTDALLEALDDIERGRTPAEDAPAIGALKAFYFKLQNVDGTMVPVSLKYSIYPAIPALFEAKENGKYKFPVLAKISQELNSGKADEIVTSTAVKVGEHNATSVENLSKNKGMVLDNTFVRHPQVVNQTPKSEDTFGSQIRKLIIANFHPQHEYDVKGLSLPGQVALDTYDEAISKIVSEGAAEVTKALQNKDGTFSEPKIVREFLSSMLDSTHQNYAYFQEAFTTMHMGKRTLPTNFPTVNFKLDNFINARYRKAVNRLKLPGFSAVQISSFGTKDISVGSDLSFVRIAKNGRALNPGTQEMNQAIENIKKFYEDPSAVNNEALKQYEVLPAEVRVSPAYFYAKLKEVARKDIMKMPKIRKKIFNDARAMQEMFGLDPKSAKGKQKYNNAVEFYIKEAANDRYKKLLRQVSRGNSLDISKIKALGLDEVVLYRIPTQGKNSMLVASIVEFLPEKSGNTIQVPGEIVDQSGSDFDIDKVFIEAADIRTDNERIVKKSFDSANVVGTTDDAKSYIYEFHKAILKSPKHFIELITPNSVNTLRALTEEFGVSEAQNTAHPATIQSQEVFRANNAAGSKLISTASIAAVAHAVAQHLPPQLSNRLHARNLVFGRQKNLKGNALISDEISEIQNAALDNAKEPLLGVLNITEFTAPVVLMMVSAGHGLRFATAIVNSPAVRDLAKVYPKWERKYGRDRATKEAFYEIEKKYGLRRGSTARTAKFNWKNYSENQAIALMDPKTAMDHSTALINFRALSKIAATVGAYQRTMNIDSKGTPASVSKLISTYMKLARIPGTLAHENEYGGGTSLIEGLPQEDQLTEKGKPIRVSDFYGMSHLAFMEKHSIHQALKTNREISPAASVQMQKLVGRAQELFGNLPENQQISMLSQYNTFLALNHRSTKLKPTHLSKAIADGDFKYLIQRDDPNATGNLLKQWRAAVKRKELVENEFLDSLQIVEDKRHNRIFVTFQNRTSRSLPADVKEDMLNYFTDLMYSDNQLEQKLAQSLAEYAVVNYGFSTASNSFIEFVPPKAYRMYFGGEKGQSLPEFFEDLHGRYNDMEVFNENLDYYLEMYAAHNWEKLDIDSYPSEEEHHRAWEEAVQMGMLESRKMTEFVRINDEYLGPRLMRRASKNVPKLITVPKRGIRNFVTEYHSGPSLYHARSERGYTAATKEQVETSQYNEVIDANIKASGSTFQALLPERLWLANYDVESVAKFTQWKTEVLDHLSRNDLFTQSQLNGIDAMLDPQMVAQSLGWKEKGNERFKDYTVAAATKELITVMLDANAKAVLKKLC